MTNKNKTKNNYDRDYQKTALEFLLSSDHVFTKCLPILKAKYFHATLQKSVKYIIDFYTDNDAIPLPRQIMATTKVSFDLISADDLTRKHEEAICNYFESFCRHMAVADIILEDSPTLIENENYGHLTDKLKDAVLISLQKNIGMNFITDLKEMLQNAKDNANYVPTYLPSLDKALAGGFTRGGLHLMAGTSGAGKSLALQNLGLNWSLKGYNVVYISLELDESLIGTRMVQMMTGFNAKSALSDIDKTVNSVKCKMVGAGMYQVVQLPVNSTVNDIRSYLKELEIQTNIVPDILLVDYLDILMPNDRRINPSDLFVKDKFVSEELRGLSTELNCVCVSASQLNRKATSDVGNEDSFDHSHIAGGKSKIDTADNVIGLKMTAAMKEAGKMKFEFLKTRSSGAVGTYIMLDFCIDTLRISDNGTSETDLSDSAKSYINKLTNNISNKSNTSSLGDSNGASSKDIAQSQRDKLNRLKK